MRIEKSGKKKKGDDDQEPEQLTNDEIRVIVESVPGCRLIYVKRDSFGAWAYFSAPDNKSRKDALDMAYKLKGHYSAEKIELTKRKYGSMSNEDLMATRRKLIDFLKKR